MLRTTNGLCFRSCTSSSLSAIESLTAITKAQRLIRKPSQLDEGELESAARPGRISSELVLMRVVDQMRSPASSYPKGGQPTDRKGDEIVATQTPRTKVAQVGRQSHEAVERDQCASEPHVAVQSLTAVVDQTSPS